MNRSMVTQPRPAHGRAHLVFREWRPAGELPGLLTYHQYFMSNAYAQRVPEPEPAALSNGGIAIARESNRILVSTAGELHVPSYQFPT